jgi:metal-responsive CopG/Arc/MetJ family transcriptional regulator
MGRPKIDEPKQQYTVMLKPSTVAEIDRLRAIRGRFSRSEMMSNLIDLGIEDLQDLDKLGLLQAAAIGDKVWKKLKEALRAGDVRLDKKGDLEIRK